MDTTHNLESLQDNLGYKFKSLDLLETSITHKSYINESPLNEIRHYERLEFLGDAVLGLIISDFLMNKFPEYSEGELSKLKGFIVSKSFIFKIAQNLELGNFLKLGRGEANSGGRRKRSILADSFEALLAAIYLDGGFDKAYNFIRRHMEKEIIDLANNTCIPDYKSILQEHTQAVFGCIPTYKLLSEKGENHNPEFEVCIYVKEKFYGQGKGRSKREAEQEAAYNALLVMNVKGIE